jgi:peptidoglycan/xylan/chitin deacetylase (PgdA/CDA1 family)
MRMPGWKSAKQAGRWARSRVIGGTLILGYHRVAEASSDPFGLCVSPRHFDEQMDVLRASTRPATLAEVVDDLGRGAARRGSVAVTFDDGYVDVARNAEPVLRRYEIPATVFVVSGSIGQRLWWDELARLVLDSSTDKSRMDTALAEIGADRVARLPLGQSERARHTRLATVHQALLETEVQKRQEFVDRLLAASGGAPVASGDEVMGADDLARLSHSGLITIGSHTVNHAALATLSEHEQRFELRESRRQLEAITGRPVCDLSYPHGSVSAVTRHLAQHSGYRSACASTQDAVSSGSDPFCLPRFWIHDWDGERFARWLHRWQT